MPRDSLSPVLVPAHCETPAEKPASPASGGSNIVELPASGGRTLSLGKDEYQILAARRVPYETQWRERRAQYAAFLSSQARSDWDEGFVAELQQLSADNLQFVKRHFDQGGHQNRYDRLIMAHHLLDCLGSRFWRPREELIDLIEETFRLRDQPVPLHLGHRIGRFREAEERYRNEHPKK